MLSGKMSNEDEDEVEDELEALEREAQGVPSMPEAPKTTAGEIPEAPSGEVETPEAKARRRRQARSEREQEQALGPIAA